MTYQFIKGDRLGQTVEIEDETVEEGVAYFLFTDGTRFNKSLQREYMMELSSGEPAIVDDSEKNQPRVNLDENTSKPLPLSLQGTQPALPSKRKENKLTKIIGTLGVDETVKFAADVKIPSKDQYDLLCALYDKESVDEQISQYVISKSKESIINHLNQVYE